jgi:hypothetical protein
MLFVKLRFSINFLIEINAKIFNIKDFQIDQSKDTYYLKNHSLFPLHLHQYLHYTQQHINK